MSTLHHGAIERFNRMHYRTQESWDTAQAEAKARYDALFAEQLTQRHDEAVSVGNFSQAEVSAIASATAVQTVLGL